MRTPTRAVLLAGGTGRRVGRDENKAFLEVAGKPIIAYSLAAFEQSEVIESVICVIRPEDRPAFEAAAAGFTKVASVVEGGPTRQASELAALEAAAPDIESGAVAIVMVHDAARPFVTPDLISRLDQAARRTGGAVPGLTPESPLWHREGTRLTFLDRSSLRLAQTPQAFAALPLLEAYRRAAAAGFDGPDTAATVQGFADLAIAVVPGDTRTFKITYAADLERAEEEARMGAWTW